MGTVGASACRSVMARSLLDKDAPGTARGMTAPLIAQRKRAGLQRKSTLIQYFILGANN
ncbi:hypothetical protein D3C80_411930 [compost metagenome]